MRRRDFLLSVVGTALIQPPNLGFAAAQQSLENQSSSTWKTLRIGGGGYVTGLDLAPDGTFVVRTDTFGGYIWDEDLKEWRQLVVESSMPPPYNSVDHHGGIYEIVVAASNSRILYMAYSGGVFRSTDKGLTWTETGFPVVSNMDANEGIQRGHGQKAAVDPVNPDHVLIGTPQNGLWRSTDAGARFLRVSDVPVSSSRDGSFPGILGIIFNRHSPRRDNLTSEIFASSYGHGVYRSIDGGATWTRTDGGPANAIRHAVIASDGQMYCPDWTEGTNAVWRWDGTWKNLGSPAGRNGHHTIMCDPFNPARIVVGTDGGNLLQSYDRGTNWDDTLWNVTRSAADIPWLGWTKETYMSNGEQRFHPTTRNLIVFAQGIGVWTTTLAPKARSVVWKSQTKGIEQLVANVACAPPGGAVVLGAWDRPLWHISDPDRFPERHGPTADFSIDHGWAIDYAASTPSFLAAVTGAGHVEQSGYSLDGGRTWKKYARLPPWDGPGKGTLAVASTQNIVWVPSDRRRPYYTKNRGLTWRPVVLPGLDDSAESYGGLNKAYYLRRHNVCADRVTPDTFYLYHDQVGLFRSTDGGDKWINIHPSPIVPALEYNMKLKSAPANEKHLWLCTGPQGNRLDRTKPFGSFARSFDGGVSWTLVPDVTEVYDFGFGKAAVGQDYPAIFIFGWVKGVVGIWRSDNRGLSWVQLASYPNNSLDAVTCVEGDKNQFNKVYVGFSGSGWAYSE